MTDKNRSVFFLGGARSGKSRYAQARVEVYPGRLAYIATAQALRDEGINYQQAMHATCIDIDATAVHMAYVQLTLLHIPVIVIHGNALSLEQWGYRLTRASAAAESLRRQGARRRSPSGRQARAVGARAEDRAGACASGWFLDKRADRAARAAEGLQS